MEAWDDEKLTLQAVKSKLLEEWEKKKDKETHVVLLVRKQRKQEFNCYFCGKPNHLKRDCELFEAKCNEINNLQKWPDSTTGIQVFHFAGKKVMNGAWIQVHRATCVQTCKC